MQRSKRSSLSRVPELDPSLPAPTTSRALLPRSRASSLARSLHSSSDSRPGSRESSVSWPRRRPTIANLSAAASSESHGFREAQDTQPEAGHSRAVMEVDDRADDSSSRGRKRKRIERPRPRRRAVAPWSERTVSGDEEENVDQLDDENDVELALTTSSNVTGSRNVDADAEDDSEEDKPLALRTTTMDAAAETSSQKPSSSSSSSSASDVIFVSESLTSPPIANPNRGTASATPPPPKKLKSSNVPNTVSSPSLAKLLHEQNVDPQVSPPSKHVNAPAGPSSAIAAGSSSSTAAAAAAGGSQSNAAASSSSSQKRRSPSPPSAPTHEPLAEYTCPICFFPPSNATLTPCGHICCGSCLFMAVKTTMQRTALMSAEVNLARCPVCRAPIPGWDGRGGGVIGLVARAVFSL